MIPETHAAQRVALLLQHVDTTHTLAHWEKVGAKLVAHRTALVAIFDELERDPGKLPLPNRDRRRQSVNRHDAADVLDDEAANHRQNADAFAAMAADARRGFRDDYDPDEVAQARQDQADTNQHHDDHAAENAPRVS